MQLAGRRWWGLVWEREFGWPVGWRSGSEPVSGSGSGSESAAC